MHQTVASITRLVHSLSYSLTTSSRANDVRTPAHKKRTPCRPLSRRRTSAKRWGQAWSSQCSSLDPLRHGIQVSSIAESENAGLRGLGILRRDDPEGRTAGDSRRLCPRYSALKTASAETIQRRGSQLTEYSTAHLPYHSTPSSTRQSLEVRPRQSRITLPVLPCHLISNGSVTGVEKASIRGHFT